jgi:hypothetical protein
MHIVEIGPSLNDNLVGFSGGHSLQIYSVAKKGSARA